MKLLKISSVLLLMAFALVSCDKIKLYNCETGDTVSVYQIQVERYENMGYSTTSCESNDDTDGVPS